MTTESPIAHSLSIERETTDERQPLPPNQWVHINFGLTDAIRIAEDGTYKAEVVVVSDIAWVDWGLYSIRLQINDRSANLSDHALDVQRHILETRWINDGDTGEPKEVVRYGDPQPQRQVIEVAGADLRGYHAGDVVRVRAMARAEGPCSVIRAELVMYRLDGR